MKKILLLFAFLLNFLNLNAQYSNLGTDFWLSFMQNINAFTTYSIIYITSPQGATGSVSMPGSGWSQNFTVGANASIEIQIPAAQNPTMENGNVALNKGIHVVSDNPIAVYAANYQYASSDAALVFPVQALGDQYMIMSYTVSNNWASEFIIIGVENNTSIQIIPTAAVIGGVGANVPFNITLNAGEVYMVQSNGDLTGSTVKATNINSCNNFAVFAGNKCAYVPTTCQACDHLYEQMIPLKAWGKNYITSPLMLRSSDQFRILAMENSTSIQINGGAPINLNAGQYYETSLSQASFITSNKYVCVSQYSKGSHCDGVESDPFMIILSPVEQFIDNIVFQAFNTPNIAQFYMNVITKTTNTNLVTSDGTPLGGWNTVSANPEFSIYRSPIAQGTHILHSDSGLLAIVYGYGYYDSYGYLAGANIMPLNVGLDIVISNDTIPYSLFHNTICINQLITFIADTSSHIYNIHFDFGDGNTANGANVSHSYQSSGTYNVTMYFTRPGSCMEDSISTILNINNISVQITPNNPEICSGNPIVLNGSGASSYSWSTGGTTASITVTPSTTTTYTVTGSNGVGCSNTATVTVTMGPSPNVNVTASPSTICPGGTSVLTASGVNTYSWDTGDNTASITVTPSSTTTYTVTGSNGVGCPGIATVSVTVNPLPTVTASANPSAICPGESSDLMVSSDITGTTFNWSNGLGTNPSVTVSPATTTTYSVTGTTPEGCTGTSEVTVTVHPLPTITATANPTAICPGESSDLMVSSDITGTTFNWSNGLGTSPNVTVSPTATTTYSVTGTTLEGCTGTAAVTVNVHPLPEITATTNPTEICPGESSDLIVSSDITGTMFNWSNGLGTNPSVTVSPTATTTYSVTGTTPEGCTGTAAVSVTVHALPNISATANPTEICPGESSDLMVSSDITGTTFNWSNGLGTNPSVTVSPTATTTYSVTGTTPEGCTGTAEVTITVNPVPNIDFSIKPAHCGQSDGNIITNVTGGIPPYAYQWSNGANSGNLTNISTGNYNLTVTDAIGCINSATIYVEDLPGPQANFTPKPQITTIDDPIIYFENYSTGANFYEWDFGDGNISTYYSPTHTYEYPGMYHVVLTASDEYGCIDTVGANIIIKETYTFYLPNAITPNDDGQNDFFNFSATNIDLDNFEMRIFDRWGKQIFFTTNPNLGWDGKYNGELVPQGVYSYIINFTDSQNYNKHILQGEVTVFY